MKAVINEKNRLNKYLKELHLPFIRSNYEDIIGNAVKESSSYESFLLSLFEGESDLRFNNRISRFLRQSKIPPGKNLDLLVPLSRRHFEQFHVEFRAYKFLIDCGLIQTSRKAAAYRIYFFAEFHFLEKRFD